MISHGLKIFGDEKSSDSGHFSNMTFVFTGSLSIFSRDEAESIVESLGGRSSSSVSRKTTIVVAGENAGSKLDKAEEFGIKVLSEQDFVELLRGTEFEKN